MQLLGRKPIGRTRCPEARALLASYVEGELDTVDRERVAGHLQFCVGCRDEERRFRSAFAALAAVEPAEAPGDLYAGFAAKLADTQGPLRRRAMGMRLAGAAACLLLVTAVVASPYLEQMFLPETDSFDIKPPRNGPSIKVTKEPAAPKSPIKIANERPAPLPNDRDGAIIEPEPFESEPVLRPLKRSQPQVAKSFLEVVPEKGRSAIEQIRDRAVDSKNALAARTVAPDPEFIRERDERIEVGDSVTTVRTGYKLDDDGRRAVVAVEIGTYVSN